MIDEEKVVDEELNGTETNDNSKSKDVKNSTEEEEVVDIQILSNSGTDGVETIPSCRNQPHPLKIFKCDEESKRLVLLALPFTFSTILETMFGSMTLIVIGRYLGSASLTAYVCVDLFLGVTDSFIHGVTEAASTLCIHAIGSENHLLAGHFIQMSTIIYICVGGPFLILWYFIIGDVMRLMVIEHHIIDLAVEYTRVVAYHFVLDGLQSWSLLLDVNGQEVFTSTMSIIQSGTEFVLVLICCKNVDTYSLYWVGMTHLQIEIFFASIWLVIALYKGWLNPFLKGLIQSNGFRVRNDDLWYDVFIALLMTICNINHVQCFIFPE